MRYTVSYLMILNHLYCGLYSFALTIKLLFIDLSVDSPLPFLEFPKTC